MLRISSRPATQNRVQHPLILQLILQINGVQYLPECHTKHVRKPWEKTNESQQGKGSG